MRRALFPLLLVTSACALLTSFEGFDVPRSRPASSGQEGGVLDDGGCAHKRWPLPSGRGGAGDLGPMVAAVDTLGFSSLAGPYPGFDLDNTCSCAEGQGCRGSAKTCDEDGGVDNEASKIFEFIGGVLPGGRSLDESGLELGLSRARFGIVFTLSGWNGEEDDDQITLSAFNAFDVEPADAGARFEGNDKWVIDETSLVGKAKFLSPYTTSEAYVSGGVLVASFASVLVKLRVPSGDAVWTLVPITLRAAQIRARITRAKDGAGRESFTLTSGEIGGRLPISDVFAVAASAGACLDPDNLQTGPIKANLCARRDIMVDPAKDGLDESCDAISAGFAFSASPAAMIDAGAVVDAVQCPNAPTISCE